MHRVAVLLLAGCFANGSLKHGAAYGVDAAAILISAFKMVRAPSVESCDGLSNDPPVVTSTEPQPPYTTPYLTCQDHNHEHHQTMLVGSVAIGAAVVGGVINYLFFDAPPENRDDALPPLEQTHDQLEVSMMEINTPSIPLMQLTRQAALAAREHHCKAVQAIAKHIAKLDDAYMRTGFVSDPAIKACLDDGKPAAAAKPVPAAKPDVDRAAPEQPAGDKAPADTTRAKQ